jgi:fatty-acyl-CoA synthase
MAVTAPALSESYYPADQRERVLDTTVGGILREAAQAVPDQIALIGGHPDPAQGRRWTYGELFEDAERCARALLRARGLGGAAAIPTERRLQTH